LSNALEDYTCNNNDENDCHCLVLEMDSGDVRPLVVRAHKSIGLNGDIKC
jgi:hypothetical protein